MKRAWAHPRAAQAGFVLVCAIALAIRLWNVDFGLPYMRHPDEAHNVKHALRIVNERDLNPHFFRYPAMLFYSNALVELIYYGFARALGKVSSFADIKPPFEPVWGVGYTESVAPFLLGRLLSVAASVVTVALCYSIARRLTGRRRDGAFAALLVAVSPVNVLNSRYISPDALTTVFVTAVVFYAVAIFREGKLRDYCLAGVAIGLAAAFKYNGVVAAVAVVAAHFARPGLRRELVGLWRPSLTGLVSALTFAVCNPYMFFDYATFRRDLVFASNIYAHGQMGAARNSLGFYCDWLLNVEGPASLLAGLFVIMAVVRRSRAWLFMSVFPLVYLGFISRHSINNDRTLLPMTPVVCVMGALAFFALFDLAVGLARGPHLRRLALAVALGLAAWLVGKPLLRTIDWSLPIGRPDAVDEAREWIDANLPPGTRIALEPYTPCADPARFVVSGFSTLSAKPPAFYAHRFDYLVISPFTYQSYIDEGRTRNVLGYKALFAAFEQIKGFPPGEGGIRVFKTNQSHRKAK
ncbi:MAG: glycosyltransferase family 39 protein [Polyangiaceae bacterium]